QKVADDRMLTSLHQRAEAAIAVKDWENAVKNLQALLMLKPDHRDAAFKLAFARQQLEIKAPAPDNKQVDAHFTVQEKASLAIPPGDNTQGTIPPRLQQTAVKVTTQAQDQSKVEQTRLRPRAETTASPRVANTKIKWTVGTGILALSGI